MKPILLADDNDDERIKYLPYIKTIYGGLEKGALKPYTEHILYSAQILSKEQIEQLKICRQNRKQNLPLSTVYSKSFLSFTQSLEVANDFLNIGKNALLTVENDPNIYNLFSQADIEEFSYSPGEKEVLFFPFSVFGVEEFTEDPNNKIHKLKLIYLGKFKKIFSDKKNPNNNNDTLPDTNFKRLFLKSGLVKENKKEQINNMNIKEVVSEYEKYESKHSKKCNKRCWFLLLGLLLFLIFLIIKKKDGDKTKCSGGYYYSIIDSMCVSCEEGYYSEAGATYCSRCDYGKSSNSSSSSCFVCPAGTYSNYNKLRCTKCPEGQYSDEGSSSCSYCPAGTYSNITGATSCNNCSAGTTSNNYRTSCINCSEGYYANSSGAEECIKCPDGYYTDTKGAFSCKICPPSCTTTRAPYTCRSRRTMPMITSCRSASSTSPWSATTSRGSRGLSSVARALRRPPPSL